MRISRAVLALLMISPASVSWAEELRPFTAEFNVTWRGISAGRSQLKLEQLAGGQWLYSSSSQARGVFRLALPKELSQRSTFEIRDARVVPLRFESDDGVEGSKRDSDMRFDWTQGRVTGVAETLPVDLPLEPGLQDGMSIQVSMMLALLQGQVPERFRMIDHDKVKEYVYSAEGRETLETPLGPQETVVFRSSRPGFTRGTWFWCAPALGYLPVKVERRDGKKVEWSMALQSAQRDTPD